LELNIKLKYISQTYYLYNNTSFPEGHDGAWTYVIKGSKTAYINNLSETVIPSLSIYIHADSFDDSIWVDLNSNRIFDIHGTDKSSGWYGISNYTVEKTYPLNLNNSFTVYVVNSGGAFKMYGLTVRYYYEWITK